MKQLLTKLLILTVIPVLGWSAGNIKTQGDAQNGSLDSLSGTDLLYILQSPYGAGDDAYITGANLSKLIDGRVIHNAVTDGGIVADYVDRLTPGTDQMAAIETWIEGGLAAGKRVFFFPPGHYMVEDQHTNSVSIAGYDSVIIFGVPGETFFHTPQGFDLKGKNHYVFGFGLTAGTTGRTKGGVVQGITFINDPYTTFSAVSELDGDIRWGWKYFEPHRVSQAYAKGDIIVSSNDNWLITVTVAGTSSGTEPTWSGATTTDGTCTVTVVALNTWTELTAYTAGTHVKTTKITGGANTKGNLHPSAGDVRSIMWAANTGTSGATVEGQLCLPSEDGLVHVNADWHWNWISFGGFAEDSSILDCEFVGMAGFGQAGGTAFGAAGEGGGLVQNCTFRDAQYGGVVTGTFDNWTFRDSSHYKIAGWGYLWGTYNAHSYYVQGARNLWDNCTFDMHFYGLDIKVHGNAPNSDNWQNRIVNCKFSNYGWGSVEFVGAGETNSATLVDGPDFVLSATSGNSQSAIMEKQGLVANCTFRIFKSVWDDFDWRRPSITPNAEGRGAIEVDCAGVNVVGCDFTDTNGVHTSTEHSWIGTNTPVNVTACSFQTIFRDGDPLNGTIWADNCQFDYRATPGMNVGVNLLTYSRLTNSSIIGSTTATGAASSGLLLLSGPSVVVDNCLIILTGVGHPVGWGNGSGGAAHTNVSMTNCIINAPSGTIYTYPRADAAYWRFANNYWNISGWDYSRLTDANHETWVWENERGNLFTSGWDATKINYNTGISRLIPLLSWKNRSVGSLVDSASDLVSAATSIYGVVRQSGGNFTPYKATVGVSENANHWILCSELVAKGDWVTLSATAGQLAPNGTSGSTTRPATGIQGRVIDAGTASAGAGRALVEVLEWNR